MFSYLPVASATQGEDSYFVVTAYYSPLPNQEYYITGDYQKELRLNGQWIAWASGKGVFSGMIAAPWKYSFWTKIYLDWLGIWSVEDRWWAIVPAGERWYSYDRIDVWMGYGDEWLRRANFWWKRKVYGYVVDPGNTTTINYKNVPAPNWAITGLKKAGSNVSVSLPITTTYDQEPISSVFDVSLAIWSNAESISEMQSIFNEMWFMSREYIDWEYDIATIENIVDFQLKYEIISNGYETWAWSFWPKTRAKLKELYDVYVVEKIENEKFLEQIEIIKQNAQENAQQYIDSLLIPKYGDISPATRELQKTLALLGHFNYKDTAIFGVKTKNSIVEYQLKKEIIWDISDIWAWLLWPKTRESIVSDLAEIYFLNSLRDEELTEKYTQLNIKWNLQDTIKQEKDISIETIDNPSLI